MQRARPAGAFVAIRPPHAHQAAIAHRDNPNRSVVMEIRVAIRLSRGNRWIAARIPRGLRPPRGRMAIRRTQKAADPRSAATARRSGRRPTSASSPGVRRPVSRMHLWADRLTGRRVVQGVLFPEPNPPAEKAAAVKRLVNDRLGRFAVRHPGRPADLPRARHHPAVLGVPAVLDVHRRLRHRGVAGAGAVAKAKSAARQSDLTEARRQQHQRPVGLLAMVGALQRPGRCQHRARIRHLPRQIADRLGRDAGDRRRPTRILWLANRSRRPGTAERAGSHCSSERETPRRGGARRSAYPPAPAASRCRYWAGSGSIRAGLPPAHPRGWG